MEQGIVPLFLDDDGPDLSEGHAHLLGHLIGIEWHESRHVKGILDDPKQIRNRAFHAAAQLFRRMLPILHPSSCSSKTCIGQTTRAWTFSPTWRRSIETCRC